MKYQYQREKKANLELTSIKTLKKENHASPDMAPILHWQLPKVMKWYACFSKGSEDFHFYATSGSTI